MPALIATSGPLSGQRFDIEDEITLGRESDVQLPDEEASRRHAVVRRDGRTAVVEDLGSLNGTYVDGRRIDGPTQLTGGESLRIGGSEFRLEPDPEPEPAVDEGATRLHQAPPDDATVLRDRPQPDETTIRARPEPAAAPPPPPQPVAAASPAPAAASPAPAAAFGELAPQGTNVTRRPKGAASRLVLPTIAAYAVILLTALALVVYFAAR